MKHYLTSIIICMLCIFSVSAQDKLVFIVGDNTCAPITVRCQGTSYRVNSYLEVDRTSSSITVSATDCSGNKLKYEFSSNSGTKNGRKYSISTYTFYLPKTYGSGNSSYNEENSGYNNSNQNWGTDPRWGNVGRELGHLGGMHENDVKGEAYPGLHLYTGISKAYGEFARLRLAYGAFNAYAGIGKDWLFDGVNKDKLLWHAGIGGLYTFGGIDPWGDILGNVTVAQTAAWENVSLMIDCDFTYWFGKWKRVGCFAGAGFGFADIKDFGKKDGGGTKFAWNVEFGLALRIAHF